MSMQCLLERPARPPGARVKRTCGSCSSRSGPVEELGRRRGTSPVDELVVDGTSVLSWEEAVECEVALPALELDAAFDGSIQAPVRTPVDVPADEQVEPILDSTGTTVGRIVRRRSALAGAVSIGAEPDDGFVRLTVDRGEHPPGRGAAARTTRSGSR